MDSVQMLTLILTSSVIGGVVTKGIDWARDSLAGHMTKRRAEVDTAIQEKNWAVRWARILEESLAIHRRQMIDAPCIDPDDMPAYPARPDRDKPST